MRIKAGARSSPLSQAQFREVYEALKQSHPHVVLDPVWASSPGDKDRKTSLRTLGKCDFFTRDLDQMLLHGEIRIAIHSAKDLPDPIPEGLCVICLTKGQDPRDSLVLREGETIEGLKKGACVATSSLRREEIVKTIRSDFRVIDLRGTIEERIGKLHNGEADGIVIAEAALIRLKLTYLNRIFLPGETVPLQGKLAIAARTGDTEIKQIFHVLHTRLLPHI